MEYRSEKDSLGSIDVPKNAYYGCQTLRAYHNFRITGKTFHPKMIHVIGLVKRACILANYECGKLDKEKLNYMLQACDEVSSGLLDEAFITDPIQGGAGTSFNMNANEVIANRAAQLAGKPMGSYDYIHPLDDVNKSQSTNDIFPTVCRITALYLVEELIQELLLLHEVFLEKSREFDDVLKPGRTHLQDAVPIRMGQEFQAYAGSLLRDLDRIKFTFEKLKFINIGATAIGTELNAPENYKEICLSYLKDFSKIDLKGMDDLIDGTRNVDSFVWASSSLNMLAINLSKICNDLRLMASGPRTGLNEIILPAKQPGSSIMPGKVNPVIPEVMNQVCFQVMGNHHTVCKAAESGQLELNVFEPILCYNLYESIEILSNGCFTLRKNALENVKANKQRCKELIENSYCILTALTPEIGYDKAAVIVKTALEKNISIKDAMLIVNINSEEIIDKFQDIYTIT